MIWQEHMYPSQWHSFLSSLCFFQKERKTLWFCHTVPDCTRGGSLRQSWMFFTNFCCFPDCQVIIFFPLISVRCSLNPIKSKMVFFLNTDCFCMCLISNYLLLFCEFGYFGFKTSCFQLVISVVMLDVMSVSHLLFLLVNFFVFIGKHVIIYY